MTSWANRITRFAELLVKAVKGEEYLSELKFLCDFYSEDICESCLLAQLETLASTFKDYEGTTLADIIALFFRISSSAQKAFLSEVGNITGRVFLESLPIVTYHSVSVITVVMH